MVIQGRKRNGQFDTQDMDKICTCGHRLGHHAAGSGKAGSERQCIAADFADIEICSCENFKKAK